MFWLCIYLPFHISYLFIFLDLLFPILCINLNSISNSIAYKFNNTFACKQGFLNILKAFTLIKKSPDYSKTLQQKHERQLHKKPKFHLYI